MLGIFKRSQPQWLPIPLDRRVRELELITARLVRRGLAGQYQAALHGRGIEFAKVREYEPGDDIRTIDWNVTARSGVPHVKEFTVERDLTVMLLLDMSGSMNFGSVARRKIEIAVELVSVLSFAAAGNGDRVGLLLYADLLRQFIPPARGLNHARRVVRQAVAEVRNTGGASGLERAVSFADRIVPKHSVIIVLSDFFDFSAGRAFGKAATRHDLIGLAVNDPREERFPARGIVNLVDSETSTARSVDLRASGRTLFANHQRELTRRFQKAGASTLFVSTAVPYESSLTGFFKSRIPRRR